MKEKLRLVQDFLHVDALDQLTSLEEKMKSSEISKVSDSLRYPNHYKSWNFAFDYSRDVTHTLYFHQEDYITKVKALLGKELNLENGSHVDGVEQNGKTNGFTNGSHKEENGEDVTMDVQEEEEAIKSPTGPKGKGGRRSKANTETKSKFKMQHLHSKVKTTQLLNDLKQLSRET